MPWWAIVSAGLSPVLLTAGWLIAGAVQPSSYSPMRQTVSVLAGHGGTDRWIMTAALATIGCCHLVTAAGLSFLRASARVVLLIAGLSAIGVAACPEPAHGSTSAHLAFTALGATAIAVWPAFVGSRKWSGSPVLSVRGSAAVTVVFLGLLAWLIAETRNGAQLGLTERLTSGVQTCWPFVVALSARRVRAAGAVRSIPDRFRIQAPTWDVGARDGSRPSGPGRRVRRTAHRSGQRVRDRPG